MIWNPSNWKCECNRACDFSEYLDYKNCICKKRSVNKLVECNKTIDEEVKIFDKNEDKCNSGTVYIVLFSVFLIINVRIGAYFSYYKYMNHDKRNVSKYYDYVYHL